MGMLDEAIREHFDLKRRNGADPAVIAIEEREALGDPAQREARAAEIAAEGEEETHIEAVVVSAEADGVAVAEVADAEAEVVEAGETTEVDVVAAGEPIGDVAEVVEEEVVVEEIPAEPPSQETRAFTVEESQEAVMPEPPTPAVGAPPERPVGTPPQAPAESAAEEGNPEEARDELEETPEFLEETPEHDRLWFERKPPRDFDF